MQTSPILTPDQRHQLAIAPLPPIRIIGSRAYHSGSMIPTQSYTETTSGRRVPGHAPDDDPYRNV